MLISTLTMMYTRPVAVQLLLLPQLLLLLFSANGGSDRGTTFITNNHHDHRHHDHHHLCGRSYCHYEMHMSSLLEVTVAIAVTDRDNVDNDNDNRLWKVGVRQHCDLLHSTPSHWPTPPFLQCKAESGIIEMAVGASNGQRPSCHRP